MNTELLGNLIRLRYKLLWAKTRSRNGRIALFLAGYLLLIMLIAILAMGGIGAGIAAVRMGKGYVISAAVLGGLYFQALLATVILGFGVNAVFADTELRRFPLRARERFVARHFLGILDPFWFLILALEVGLVVGLYLVGGGSFWLGLVAVVLLLVSNYLVARVIALLVERLTVKKGGSAVLLGLVLSLSLLPSLIEPLTRKNRHLFDPVLQVLMYTPPAEAARATTGAGVEALGALALLACWIGIALWAVQALERRPPRQKVEQSGKLSFEGPWEKIGAFFGPRDAPLVAHWLRFYSRNNRFRTIYPLAMPLVAFLTFTQARVSGPKGQFANLLGCFALVGCIGTAQFAVNQFGYLGGGLRRLFLLPADPADILRTGSYVFVTLGALLIPLATVLLLVVSPMPLDSAKVAMLLGAAIAALFFMNGLGLWASVLGPRRGNFTASFGNDLSLAGNIAVIGGMFTFLFVPRILVHFWPGSVVPERWFAAWLLAALMAAFYYVSLGRTAALFRSRKERVMSVIEGRQ
jgi:hypothetical protein